FEVSQLQVEWRLLRFSLLGLSIACFAARLGISQFREATSANEAMIHALAMDSAVDGISMQGKEGEHLYVNSAFEKRMGFELASRMVWKIWPERYDERDG